MRKPKKFLIKLKKSLAFLMNNYRIKLNRVSMEEGKLHFHVNIGDTLHVKSTKLTASEITDIKILKQFCSVSSYVVGRAVTDYYNDLYKFKFISICHKNTVILYQSNRQSKNSVTLNLQDVWSNSEILENCSGEVLQALYAHSVQDIKKKHLEELNQIQNSDQNTSNNVIFLND